MATSYQVTVQLSADTLSKLSASGNVLYGLLATQTSDAAALPLVWLSQPKYSMSTLVEWSDAYRVYTSLSPLSVSAGPVFVGASAALQLGQLLDISTGGSPSQPLTGFPGVLAVHNATTTAYVTGVMQTAGGAPATPTCGLPLNGHEGLTLVPQAKLVLLFSSAQVATGQAVTQWLHTAYDAVLIDLTTVAQRSLTFDINAGWSWGPGVWAEVKPFGTDLSNALIIPSLHAPMASQWAMLQL